MKRTVLTFLLFLTAITLSSCGGGGNGAAGSTPGNNNPPNGFNLVLTPQLASLPANTLGYPIFSGSPFLTQLNVRVTFSNGQIAPDGTVVNLTTDNVNVAFITILDDPATTAVNEFTTATGTNNTTTSGGQAVFFINAGTQGTARFTASATSENRSYTGTLSYTITAGPDPTIQQLSAALPRTNLPVNNLSIPFFNGTPFMMEADLQFKDVFGNFTNPDVDANGDSVVNVTITPANVLYFTPLDDPATTDINEMIAPEQSSGSIQMNSGHGHLFLWSKNIPGNATVTLSATEVGSGRVLSSSFNIQVVDDGSNPGQPSSIALNNNGGALYINGSGGTTSRGINVTVKSGNVPVLDPQVNNVKLSIVTDGSNSGEKLTGTNVSGASVQGTSINIATVNGIANALVNSGSNTNTITLTATIDRADNNVDNGIQDGISSPTTYIVSDGVLWALQITSPALDALTVNGPSTNNGQGGVTFEFQDGTYSLVISAIATDKGGNPALPQTLQFGMINSPITGYPDSGSGTFVISGTDGDPQEGESIFRSNSGAFLTAAGGVQPSDTLVVFGEESLGNEDLESAVTVSSVNSNSSLNINEKFNRNDGTGVINNDGGVLPYAIGRAVDGNINATAVINDVGVATTKLNYPVSQLGKIAAVFVKGQGVIVNGLVKSVTDAQLITFPGIEGFNGQNSTLTVSPNLIPGNISTGFVVCLADSARNPLPGRHISFSYAGGNGQGSVDGILGSGVMVNPTGVNGCATGVASTTGVISGATNSGFNFFSGSLTCDLMGSSNTNCMDVVASANGVLNANPSSFIGRGSVNITLTLFDGSGQPIQGASISGSCDQVTGGSLGIIAGPSVTNGNGQSSVTVSVALDAPMGGLSGACTFATATGSPTVDVNFSGGDSCVLVAPSPLPPTGACP